MADGAIPVPRSVHRLSAIARVGALARAVASLDAVDDRERDAITATLEFLERAPEPFDSVSNDHHVTSSAFVVSERGVILHRHLRLGIWVQRKRRTSVVNVESGTWGIGLLTRLPLVHVRTEPLQRLPRERVRRAVIVADLLLDERAFTVLALHGAHLSHGSFRQYRRVREIVEELGSPRPLILAGDFNSWRPPLRIFLPGWHSLVRARTWPASHPHSQIDHIFGSGPWRQLGGGASDGGSDHRALFADVSLG